MSFRTVGPQHHFSSQQAGFDNTSSDIPENQFYRRVVTWITKDRPQWQKVCIYTLVAIATIALACSVVGIPYLVNFLDVRGEMKRETKIETGDAAILKIFQGQGLHSMDDLPPIHPEIVNYSTLNSVQLASHREEFPSIKPDAMKGPIARGTDKSGHPFIAIKFCDKHEHNRVFVQIIRRQYTHGSNWCAPLRTADTVFSTPKLDAENLELLRTILNGTHARYYVAD